MRLVLCAFILACPFAPASLAQPVSEAAAQPSISPPEFLDPFEHLLGPAPILSEPWADLTSGLAGMGQGWTLDITVDETGKVADAVIKYGSEERREEVLKAARAMTFRPFERDGKPARVQFAYYIRSEPEDFRGAADRSFPADADLSKAVIRLKRTSCFGTCPDYEVEVNGKGEVTYSGESFVLVGGLHTWRIPQSDVAYLIGLFRQADYFRLKGYYIANVTDLPTFVTRLSLGGRDKFVLDYAGAFNMGGAFASTSFGGPDPEMPKIVSEIEDEIDRISGAESLVRGDANTISRLRSARWNFKSREGEAALAFLLDECRIELARQFIAQGAPADSWADMRWGGDEQPAIALAARCGDVAFVRQLASRGALDRQIAQRYFLEAAIASGYPEMVDIALEYGARIRWRTIEGEPIVHVAAGVWEASDDLPRGGAIFDPAAVVRRLLAAGADPNAKDESGRTPLQAASTEKVVRALLEGGADARVLSPDGESLLFNQYDPEVIVALVQAGLDVSLRNKAGQTALFGQRYAEATRALIKAGADPNAVDPSGRTPLETVEAEATALVLLDAGARAPTEPARLQALIARFKDREYREAVARLQKLTNGPN